MKPRIKTSVLLKALPFFILILMPHSVRAERPDLDPNSEHVVEIVLEDGTTLSNPIIIYPVSRSWFIPIGAFSEVVGLSIEASSGLAVADGFILESSRRFHMDVNKCKVEYGPKRESFDCNSAVVFHEDVYVELGLLERWLPLKIAINPGTSQLLVTPLEKLPVQLRREREQLAERSKGILGEYDPGFPRVPTPYSLLDGPFIDEQISFSRRFSPTANMNSLNHDTQLSGEVLGLDTYSYLSGDERKISNWRLSFSRKDPGGNLMGPFGFRDVEFFHVEIPSLPLISNLKLARGFLVSNFPLDAPTSFQSQDFEGPLPMGWEVVLYWNDILMDRRLGDSSGRYVFTNIPLIYGGNLFRLSFFGPRGERREEFKNYNIGPGLLPEGHTYYRTGVGVLEDSRQRITVQVAKNLTRYFTATGGVLYDKMVGTASAPNYVYLGITGVNELFLFSGTCAFASYGGKICEWDERMALWGVTFGGKYTRLFNYRSELFNSSVGSKEYERLSASLLYPIRIYPPLQISFDLTKKNFEDQLSETSAINRVSMNAGFLGLTNELTIPINSVNPILGKWKFDYVAREARFLLGANYSTKRLMAIEFGGQQTISNSYSGNAKLYYPLDGTKATMNLAVSKLFKSFSLTTNFNYTDAQNFGTGITLAFSLARDSVTDEVHLLRNPLSAQGAASVRVFNDSNRNGKFDSGEQPTPNMELLVNQRAGEYKTEDNGSLFIPYLRPYNPTDLEFGIGSLNDVFLRPAKPGARIFPRAGKTTQVDLALNIVGQIDGIVTQVEAKGSRSRRGVEIELMDATGKVVAKTRTDRDGFYVFDSVAPGKYGVKIAATQLTQWELSSQPERHGVVVPPEGSFESGLDFSLVHQAVVSQ